MATRHRTISAALIVCTFAQPVVPLLARQATAAGITIAAMDRGSVNPFDRLVISGSGFQPATAAISVLFVPKQHGVPVVIPVFSATATRVEVIVPTFLDPTRSDFGFGLADVQVVQVTRDQVMSSNVLSGLDVAPIPSLPASVGTGRVTRAFMRLSVEFLTAANATPDPEARSFFKTFKDEQAALVALVEGVVATPGSIAVAKTVDSSGFVIDGAMLKASDRLIAAYLRSIAPLITAGRLARNGVQPLASGTCSPDIGDAAIEADMCAARIAGLDSTRKWMASIAAVAGFVAVVVALSMTGPVMMGVGAAAGVGLFLAGAAQLAYLGVAASLTPPVQATDAERVMDALRFQGRTMFATGSAAGASMTSAAMAGADAVTQVATRDSTTLTLAPKYGAIVAAPRIADADTTRQMESIQGNGNSAVATRIGVPSAQSTKTLVESRIAPTELRFFDGAYAGTVDVIATDPQVVSAPGLPFAFTVAAGSITVTAPSGGSGSVSVGGRVELRVGQYCSFTGALEATTATAVATGVGTAFCAGGGITGGGPWTAARR